MRTTFILAVIVAASAQSQTVHKLSATPTTVAYGYYWSEAKPALRVKSGDIVEVETMLTNTPTGLERLGVKPADVPQALRDIVAQDTGSLRGPGGHILTGPIYVEGADSGDVLEVRILSVSLASEYAYNGCRGFVPELCGPPDTRVSTLVHLDRQHMTAEVMPGVVVPLRPFFGTIGTAPAGKECISSLNPGPHGANMDFNEVVAGVTMQFPVFEPGALFMLGDGHAAQGDGEIDGAAIETSFDVKFTVNLIKGKKINWPHLINDNEIMSIGSTRPLIDALRLACVDMVDWLVSDYGFEKYEAVELLGQTAHLYIANVVDPQFSVACALNKKYLPK
jgi:acetamidase/formamidase